MGLIEKKENKSSEDMKRDLLNVIDCLADYEESGLTSEQVMDLSEAVKKLERYFGDKITVNQVIDFFVDFYIAQGDPERTEGALLLTNEAVTEYRKLKERDTVMEINEIHVDEYYCPACGAENNCDQGVVEDNFCPRCGRRLKRRED